MAFMAAAPQRKDIEIPVPAGSDGFTSLSWAPSTNFLAASSWDNKVRVWDVQRGPGNAPVGGVGRVEFDAGAPLLDVCWKEDGAHLFLGGCGKTVKLLNLTTNVATDIGAHDAPVKGLGWAVEKQFLVTGSWDKTLKYWDTRSPTAALSVPMPERIISMDVKYPLMVVGTADKKIYIFHLDQPQRPLRELVTPLKLQTRVVKAFHSKKFFAVGSIEGRCAIRAVDEAMDNELDAERKPKWAFAFRCHRDGNSIFAVNAIDAHPNAEYHGVFATAGSDGVYAYWHKDKRTRLKEQKASTTAISACSWNPTGDMFAYAASYDWSKGSEGAAGAPAPQIFIQHTMPDDLRVPVQQGR